MSNALNYAAWAQARAIELKDSASVPEVKELAHIVSFLAAAVVELAQKLDRPGAQF